MPIQVNEFSKHFRLCKWEAWFSGALRLFFNRKYENFHAPNKIYLNIDGVEVLGTLGENSEAETALIKLLVLLLFLLSCDIDINGISPGTDN